MVKSHNKINECKSFEYNMLLQKNTNKPKKMNRAPRDF